MAVSESDDGRTFERETEEFVAGHLEIEPATPEEIFASGGLRRVDTGSDVDAGRDELVELAIVGGSGLRLGVREAALGRSNAEDLDLDPLLCRDFVHSLGEGVTEHQRVGIVVKNVDDSLRYVGTLLDVVNDGHPTGLETVSVETGSMTGRGLNADGTIAREGAPHRVSPTFAPVVDALCGRLTETFGSARLHSAYLYGSIPCGTAVPGASDLDVLLAFHDEPTEMDRADAKTIESALDTAFPQIDGAGILLSRARSLLADRYDGGFFVACLCTPLLGEDLADQLPRYRPTSLLARETSGDLGLVLPRWRRQAAEDTTDSGRRALSRKIARRVVRTGFTLIMPRWGGWTSDLDESAALFGRYYPDRAAQMRIAAVTGRAPSTNSAVLEMLVDDLGPWLAAEYTAVHGEKASRIDDSR